MYLIRILSETQLRYDISLFTKNTSKWIYKLLQSKIVIHFCLLNLSSYYQFTRLMFFIPYILFIFMAGYLFLSH